MAIVRKLYNAIVEKIGRKERIWKITRKQTVALLYLFYFLKMHAVYTGIFVSLGNQRTIQKLLLHLLKGDPNIAEYLHHNSCSPRECASAVNIFLQRKRPLLPIRVQKLLMAKNCGVTPKMIALDALGLILEEFYNTNKLKIVYGLLELMKVLSTVGSLKPTEVRISHAPYILLPIFFEEKPDVTLNWKRVCDVVNEMIMMCDLLLSPTNLSRTIVVTKREHLVFVLPALTLSTQSKLLKNPIHGLDRSQHGFYSLANDSSGTNF